MSTGIDLLLARTWRIVGMMRDVFIHWMCASPEFSIVAAVWSSFSICAAIAVYRKVSFGGVIWLQSFNHGTRRRLQSPACASYSNQVQ